MVYTKKEEPNRPKHPHPHDMLVRNVLADVDLAADFLRNYLPPEWDPLLEWDSLQRESGEAIAPNLSELVGDLRYSARFKGSGGELKVIVCLEHQSRPDKYMTFRMLGYVYSVWHQQFATLKKKKERFPYPLAVVLHHGKTPWKRIPPMRELIALPPGVPGDILDLPICMVDLATMSPEQLSGHPMVRALLDSLQSASMGTLPARIIDRLRGLDDEGRVKPWATALGNYYSMIQGRLRKQVQKDYDILASAFAGLFGKQGSEEMMTTLAETWMMEGVAKGRAEGHAEGRIDSTMTVLESRFGSVPAALQKKLRTVRDDGRMEEMLRLAATCGSLKEFQKAL